MSKQKWQATKPDGKCFDTSFDVDFEGSCWSTCIAPVVDENEDTVALIVDVNDRLTCAEFNSRMHLIAAAPELLDALIEAIPYIEAALSDHDASYQHHLSTDQSRQVIMSDLNQVKQAITKTKGRIIMICTIRFKDELFTCYGNGKDGSFIAGYCKNYGLECESKAFGEWMGKALQEDLLKYKECATWIYDCGWKLNPLNSIYGLRYNKVSDKVSIEERVGWDVIQDIANLCGWGFSVDVVGDYLKVKLAKK